MAGKPWSDDEMQEVRDRAGRGETDGQIADAMPGRTRSAISQMRERYGIPAGSENLPTVDDEVREIPDVTDPVLVETGEYTAEAVSAGGRITSLEALLEACDVDPDAWEVERHVVNKWEVGVKVGSGDDVDVKVEPLFQVKAWLKKKWEATDLPTPVVLKITRPKKRPPSAGRFVSVHYSDSHIPYHDERCDNILYQVLDYLNPHMVVNHGDLMDCEEISRWPKDPYDRTSLKEEIQLAAKHLGVVHSLTPDAEHVLLEGNHEDRLRRTIWSLAESRQAGEVLTLDPVREALQWPSLLGIGELGWDVLPYPRHRVLFDRLILKHGNTVRKHAGYSAKAEYDKYGKSGLSGHTHRQGMYSHRDYNGTKAWWEIGMMGRIREDYVDHANWSQGFAVVSWDADRTRFGVELVTILDGVTYFRGQRFEGDSRELAAA